MTRKELSARAANIHRAVASTTACTSATVESLRSFLAPALNPVLQQKKPSVNVPPPKGKGLSARPVKATVARAGKRPAVTILEIPGEQSDRIQSQDRLILATEVVNATLKSLTDAIKDFPARKTTQAKRRPLATSSSSSSFSNGLESRSQTPLQPLCINRLANSPGKQSHSRRSSTSSTKQTIDGLRAQAECARIAFATLRNLQCQKDSSMALPFLQLESGMSALIAKMLALGFDDIALREIRILKRRLEVSKVPSSGQAPAASAGSWKEEGCSDPKTETLAEMLRFRNTSARGQLLSLIITTQLQVLKILALRREASVTQVALQHLQFSASHSPANLILRQLEMDVPESKEKVARQLESLAQALIALCPHVSSDDDKPLAPSINVSPDITFQIQLLASQVRSTWWEISGHQGNVAKEIVEPFSRCLAVYNGRSMSTKVEKYEVAKSALEVIKKCVRKVKGFREEILYSAYRLLAESAQDASQYSQAIHWVQKARECAPENALSRTQICDMNCRLASLELRSLDSDPSDQLISLLRDAAKSLGGDLQGESAELDELLLAVASLRKSAFLIFQESHRSSKAKEIRAQAALVYECSNIVLLCARFLVRYVGSSHRRGGHEKTTIRRDQRRKMVARFATPTIESVVAIARLSADSEAGIWNPLEMGLQDCLRLASSIADSDPGEIRATGEDNRGWSLFVSISNAYWYRYLRLKRGANDAKSCRECLMASIELIRDRPLCEKLAGSLALKLEKFGQLCEELRDYKKAAESYEEALHIELDSGLLRTAAEAAAMQSVPNVLELNNELLPLSRKLSAYLRAALKAVDQGSRQQLFYDATELSASERGVLLEQQLVSLLSTMDAQGQTPSVYNALNKIGTLLLSTYERKKFPVRRLRVVVRLLRPSLTAPGAFENSLVDQLLEEPIEAAMGAHFDMDLLRFVPHLTTCRCLLITLRQKSPNCKDLESVLASWSKLIQGSIDWASLQTQVYDIIDWLIQLEILDEYLDVQGLELYRVSALNVAVVVHEAALSVQRSALVSKLSELGLEHVRLGYSRLAGSVLHKAQKYLGASDLISKVKLRWHLSYAEYALANGNLKTCKESLARARELFEGGACMETPEKMRSKNWSDLSQTTADACYVHSLLAVAEGQQSKALFFARLCVKNCHRSWAILERSQNRIDGAVRKRPVESENDPLVDGMSELSISTSTEDTSTPHSMLSGVAFWTLVPRLVRGLNHLSLLFSYNGLYPETRYYLQQGQKIAKAVEAASLNSQTTALLGNYLIRSGRVDEGLSLVQQAEQMVSGLPHDRHYASLQLSLATHHSRRGEMRAGESAIGVAESTIQNLVAKSFVDGLVQTRSTTATLEIDMSALTLQEPKPARPTQSRQRQTISKRPQSKSVAQRDSPKSSTEEVPTIEVTTLHRMRGEIVRGRIFAKMIGGGLDAAASLLNETDARSHDQQDIVLQALLSSRIHYRQGLEHFVSDPVFCVIPESTISCPAIKAIQDKQDKQTKSSSPPKSKSATSSRSTTAKASTKKMGPRSLSLAKDQAKYLCLAQDEISNVFRSAITASPTAIVHEISDVLGKVLVVLSAVSSQSSRVSITPGVLLYFSEMGRTLSMIRESSAIQVECKLPDGKDSLDWPKEDAVEGHGSGEMHNQLELSTFQAEYIDIIPQDWNVVSMTLSQERDEILISKMRAGQTPFILRLPLNRHNSMDQEEETFGYDQGKAELHDIISLANISTHSAQEFSHKGAKTEWWEGRATLDARLKDLLTNMENIWLGGFKAIFSQTAQSPALLSRFQQSLQNILDKHLPSRQKTGRGSQSSRVAFDLRVLELFVGLGNPSDSNDLEEPLVDLLYFVVDILQFNGERNAYDEVDFDSIVVNIIDALRHYHQAIEDEQGKESEKHIILILDKNLHCFPWESLPCIRDHAVTRLPSLKCLRDRVSQHNMNPTNTDGRIHANRNNGASILNPGGDLTATQAKFEETLHELSGWKCIVQREPTEAEMRNCLESHDIFLYFGHGSGGQYIRSRTIKKLDKCAVALLMGCSSGALTEAGEFEPYGTPMNYMHAGCPAMLATLWDVTDKDIDRFSQTVLEKWGLFEGRQPLASSSPVKKGAKQKGKGRAKNVEKVERDESKPLSLDQAVAQGRDSCILRYLNGAAPVVYGVPVYLS